MPCREWRGKKTVSDFTVAEGVVKWADRERGGGERRKRGDGLRRMGAKQDKEEYMGREGPQERPAKQDFWRTSGTPLGVPVGSSLP